MALGGIVYRQRAGITRPAALHVGLAIPRPIGPAVLAQPRMPARARVVVGSAAYHPAYATAILSRDPANDGGNNNGRDSIGAAANQDNLASPEGGTTGAPHVGLGGVLHGLAMAAGIAANIVPGLGLVARALSVLSSVGAPSVTAASAVPAGIMYAGGKSGQVGTSVGGDPLETTAQTGAVGATVEAGIASGQAPTQSQIDAALQADINASLGLGGGPSSSGGASPIGGVSDPGFSGPADTASSDPSYGGGDPTASDNAIGGVDLGAGGDTSGLDSGGDLSAGGDTIGGSYS